MAIRSSALAAFEKTMLGAARAVSFMGYPVSLEKMEIDENQSLWASYTPDYRPGSPLRENLTCDLAIIGGGFTGVSTAYHFSQRYPQKRVVLLEAKSLANGASGRNGGMMLNWINGVEDKSPEMTQRVYEATHAGIDMIEAIIQKHQLKVSYRRDGSLEVYTDERRAENACREIEKLKQLGIPVQFLDPDALTKTIRLENVYGARFDPTEGQLNGAQLIRALRPVLVEQGVEIYEQTPVLKVREGTTITLTTPHAEVKAGAMVLALNGYTGKLGYFRKQYFPLHSHVFATTPLTPEAMEALGWYKAAGYSDDLDRISYSSRTREGHIVFGGGSNASYAYLFNNRTAYPGTPHSAGRAFDAMRDTQVNYLPAAHALPISHRWTGTLAITFKRNCTMGVMGDSRNVFYALGYSGHGVTLANMAGRVLTDMYSGDDQPWRKLPFYQARLTPIPLEPFRWIGYKMMTAVTGRSPRLG